MQKSLYFYIDSILYWLVIFKLNSIVEYFYYTKLYQSLNNTVLQDNHSIELQQKQQKVQIRQYNLNNIKYQSKPLGYQLLKLRFEQLFEFGRYRKTIFHPYRTNLIRSCIKTQKDSLYVIFQCFNQSNAQNLGFLCINDYGTIRCLLQQFSYFLNDIFINIIVLICGRVYLMFNSIDIITIYSINYIMKYVKVKKIEL
ncbi:unnamed protein product [Paramecium primaurelia]|uniref:Transmembrane protein n=1 Tax=Paramecium primaurelia TaxID=5886 RepID=A0A8S1NRR1_PARPR|nr:unnamed protein product [Paramecium primaurelia]